MSTDTEIRADARQDRPETSGRGVRVALWVVQGLLAAAFAMSAVAKLAGNPQAVAIFEAMGTEAWMPYGIAALELAGAGGLLSPRLSGLAGLGSVGLMVGALGAHAIWGGPPAPPGVLLILAAVVTWGRRERIRELLLRRG